jgi:AcrR family transcriptional regulator
LATQKNKHRLVQEFRRAGILETACSLFARRGFAGTLMDDIARESGLAKGTLYLYFRSKKAICRELLLHHIRVLHERTLARMNQERTLRGKVGAYISLSFSYCDEHRDFFRILHTEAANLSGPPILSKSQLREWQSEPAAALAEAIRAATARRELGKLQPEAAAWAIIDITRGAIERHLSGQSPAAGCGDAAFLAEFVWTALSKFPASRPRKAAGGSK